MVVYQPSNQEFSGSITTTATNLKINRTQKICQHNNNHYLTKGVEPTFKMSFLPNTPQTTDTKYNIGIICLCVVMKLVIIKVISSTTARSVLNVLSGVQKSGRNRNPATADS
jgi:hypothetical protein